MKVSLFNLAVPAALFTQTAHSLVVQRDVAAADNNSNSTLSSISSLVADVQQHADNITVTGTSLSHTSTAAQNASAEQIYIANFHAIGADVDAINTQLQGASFDATQYGALELLLSKLSYTLEEAVDIVLTASGLGVLGIAIGPVEQGVDAVLGSVGLLLDGVLVTLGGGVQGNSTTSP